MIKLGNTAAPPAARADELHAEFLSHALIHMLIGRVQLVSQFLQFPAQTGKRIRADIIIIVKPFQFLHFAMNPIMQVLYAGPFLFKNNTGFLLLFGRQPGQPALRARSFQGHAPPVPARMRQRNGGKAQLIMGVSRIFSLPKEREQETAPMPADAARLFQNVKAKNMPSRQHDDRNAKAGYAVLMSVFSRLRRRVGAPSSASSATRRPPAEISSAPVGLLLGGAYWLVTREPGLIRVLTPEVMLAVASVVLVAGVAITCLCALFSVNRYLHMDADTLYHI